MAQPRRQPRCRVEKWRNRARKIDELRSRASISFNVIKSGHKIRNSERTSDVRQRSTTHTHTHTWWFISSDAFRISKCASHTHRIAPTRRKTPDCFVPFRFRVFHLQVTFINPPREWNVVRTISSAFSFHSISFRFSILRRNSRSRVRSCFSLIRELKSPWRKIITLIWQLIDSLISFAISLVPFGTSAHSDVCTAFKWQMDR